MPRLLTCEVWMFAKLIQHKLEYIKLLIAMHIYEKTSQQKNKTKLNIILKNSYSKNCGMGKYHNKMYQYNKTTTLRQFRGDR